MIITTRQNGASVLLLSGELDLASAPQLARALENEASGRAVVVIDLTGLDFMDSSGVHTLLDAQSRSQENGHQLVLRRGPPQVQRIFALTGTLDTFSFQD